MVWPFGKCDKEGDAMRKAGWTILALLVGMLFAAGVPYPAVTEALADPGCGYGCGYHEGCGRCCNDHGEGCPGCGCECCGEGWAGQEAPPCMQDNAAGVPGGMRRMMRGKRMGGGAPMMKGMARHMEEMEATILKLRALEAKMDALKSKDDAAFRAASLEHAKLLTDLQESHLKHMEGMMEK